MIEQEILLNKKDLRKKGGRFESPVNCVNKEERVEKISILSKDDVVKESKGSKRVCIEKTKNT